MRSAIEAATPRSWVTRSSAQPCSRLRRSNSSRTCACTLTSNAVVGSSATMSNGAPFSSKTASTPEPPSLPSAPRAIASITRWRRPPDSSWGHWRVRSLGSGTPAWLRFRRARSALTPRSVSWVPMRMVGSSEVSGSWNTAPSSLRRTARRCAPEPDSMSAPATVTEPPMVVRRDSGGNPSRQEERTLLPDPDSPTRASTSPGRRSRLTPLRAWTRPWAVSKLTSRSRTSAMGSDGRGSESEVIAVTGAGDRRRAAAGRRSC